MPDSDPFNMVSGSVGIIGAVDSMYVLEKDKRTENKAILHVTGRDIEDMQLQLAFDRDMTVWQFISFVTGEKSDNLIATIVAFISENKSFCGTATELLDGLKKKDRSLRHSPTSLNRALKEQLLTLEKRHNISVTFNRTNSTRTISLSVRDGDVENTHGDKDKVASLA